MTIKIFKLITGEDMITSVKENLTPTPGTYVLDNPAVLVVQRNGDQMGVALAPYAPFIDGDITLNKTAIVSEGNPDQKLANEYNARFGSGIVVAPASALSSAGIIQ